MNIHKHIGEQIAKHRKLLKYSQDELAGALSLTRTSIVNIEKGRQHISAEMLLRICAVLKCDFGDIMPTIPSVELKQEVKIKKVIKSKTLKAEFKWQ